MPSTPKAPGTGNRAKYTLRRRARPALKVPVGSREYQIRGTDLVRFILTPDGRIQETIRKPLLKGGQLAVPPEALIGKGSLRPLFDKGIPVSLFLEKGATPAQLFRQGATVAQIVEAVSRLGPDQKKTFGVQNKQQLFKQLVGAGAPYAEVTAKIAGVDYVEKVREEVATEKKFLKQEQRQEDEAVISSAKYMLELFNAPRSERTRFLQDAIRALNRSDYAELGESIFALEKANRYRQKYRGRTNRKFKDVGLTPRERRAVEYIKNFDYEQLEEVPVPRWTNKDGSQSNVLQAIHQESNLHGGHLSVGYTFSEQRIDKFKQDARDRMFQKRVMAPLLGKLSSIGFSPETREYKRAVRSVMKASGVALNDVVKFVLYTPAADFEIERGLRGENVRVAPKGMSTVSMLQDVFGAETVVKAIVNTTPRGALMRTMDNTTSTLMSTLLTNRQNTVLSYLDFNRLDAKTFDYLNRIFQRRAIPYNEPFITRALNITVDRMAGNKRYPRPAVDAVRRILQSKGRVGVIAERERARIAPALFPAIIETVEYLGLSYGSAEMNLFSEIIRKRFGKETIEMVMPLLIEEKKAA